jgi:polysaccharide export outer membrane protein
MIRRLRACLFVAAAGAASPLLAQTPQIPALPSTPPLADVGPVSVRPLPFAFVPPAAAQAPTSAAPPADYVVGPQDVLNVVVFGEAELTRMIALDADSSFDYPFVGRIQVAGFTARKVGEELAARLKQYFVNPQVSVEVVKFRSQKVIVMGLVHAPGQYPLTGSMSVLEVLAAAGSPTSAAASYVTVLRPSGNQPRLPQTEPGGGSSLRLTMKELQGGQVPAGFALRDGDTINVPKAETVTVIGHVKTTGPVILDGDMSVMQVIGLAGGITEKGALNRVKIHRMIDGKMQEVKGVKVSDLVRPGDTIEVPQRYF